MNRGYAFARDGASAARTKDARVLLARALEATARRRAGTPGPAAFIDEPHPWTLDAARALAREVDAAFDAADGAGGAERHLIAADGAAGRFGATPDQPGERLLAPAWLYDLAWRTEAGDGARMTGLVLAARLVWRGAWPEQAAACDQLAATAASLRAIAVSGDPDREVDGMALHKALAYRISAFAPAGGAVLLAFHGEHGFTLFDHVTGERAVTRRS